MRIKDVDFPQELLDSQKEGSLVLFAGAGVSIPPPSNYPNFDSLADEVAAGSLTRDTGETVDRFMGRLKDRGIRVHEIVHRLLSDPKSKPNTLHTDLLRLFGEPSKVRLVTTNFDEHFTSAAKSLFPADSIEIYSAPALPPGHSLYGIVHLHGSVAKPPARLVLTDSDFGAAYLTEGWARRFLQGLFATSVVFFVGYSHRDTVMDYLARGLPPRGARFALAEQGTESHWKRLGIIPVTYPATAGDTRHSAVVPALKGWADRIWTAALDHEVRIKSIVQAPVSLDPEELDYLESACKDVSLARFFTRYAKNPEWLRWAEGKGIPRSLFRQTVTVTDIEQEFAFWFARDFACEHCGDALAVIERQGGTLSAALWYQIALAFHSKRPMHEVVSRWVPILVSQQPVGGSKQLLEYVLSSSRFPEEEATILLLFEHLTRPHVSMKKNFLPTAGDAEDVQVELSTEGGKYWLNHAWINLLQPNLQSLSNKLLWLVTSHFHHAYELLRSFGRDRPNWDPLSSSRGLLESTTQGSPNNGIGLLVDVAREVLSWQITHQPEHAHFCIDLWFSSGCRILRRLAIFGVAESSHWNSDQKMHWLIENKLLYTYGLKHEVFLVLQKGYASASETCRLQILERAEKGSDALEGRTKDYEIFNLLYWLAESAPNCEHAKGRLEMFSQAHPEFGPREHPDLDSWISSGWVGQRSPLSTDEILNRSPEDLLQFIASFSPADPFGSERDGLIAGLQEAIKRQHDWGDRLVRVLKERKQWDTAIWKAIVSAWTYSDLREEQWKTALATLLDTQEITSLVLYEASQFLENGVDKKEYRMPISCLELAFSTGRKLWDASVNAEEPEHEDVQDWLQRAINHPGGILMTFWLRALSRLRETAAGGWTGIPESSKELLNSLVSGESYTAELGRVLIASQMYFLFTSDEQWTTETVFPLFYFSKDSKRAIQAWDGYLVWGRWTERMLPHLMPAFLEAFPRLQFDFEQEQRNRFCGYLAGIACSSAINPLENGWLNRFLVSTSLAERTSWAFAMLSVLKGMKEAATENAWTTWIRTYWERQIEGIPVPLDKDEMASMIQWAVCFKASFPEVTAKIYASPVPHLEHSFLHDELRKSGTLTQHPEAISKFALFLLKNGLAPAYYPEPILNIVEQLKNVPAAKENLLSICDELAALGYPGARALRDSIP